MKTPAIFGLLWILCMTTISCDSDSPSISEFTGSEVTYNLLPGSSQFSFSGIITFKERTDQSITVDIEVPASGSGGLHPVHLHYGTFDTPNAEIAVMLTPVDASTGLSTTTFNTLLDQSVFTYADLLAFNGSVKIHLDDGANKHVVLAAANIGLNAGMDISDITVCSSDTESI